MHDQFEAHLAAYRCFAKDRTDIQQANAPHFEQVLQQVWALALDRGLVNAVQVDRIIGHQTVATRNQLQAQLALAQAGLARDQHTQAQNIDEHAVHCGAVSEMFGQISPQHIDDESRWLMRCKHRDLGTLTHRYQRIRRGLVVCEYQGRGLECHDTGDPALAVLDGCIAEVGDFALTHDLDAVGMDVVQVAHEVSARTRRTHRHLVKAPLRGPQAGDPLPLQSAAKLFKERISADNIGFHESLNNNGQPTLMRCTANARQAERAITPFAWIASLRSCRAVARRRCRT